MTVAQLDPRLRERLEEARERLGEVEAHLASPEVLSDRDRLRELGQERAGLDPIVRCFERLEKGSAELAGAIELAEESEEPGGSGPGLPECAGERREADGRGSVEASNGAVRGRRISAVVFAGQPIG